MKQSGTLIHDAAYALAFHALEPRPEQPRALLILLHGVGGDEHQLEPLGAATAEDVLVVLPRGPRSISGDRLGWFREGLSEDGPQIVEDEAEDARLKLVEFISQLQQRFGVPPSHTVAAGFSQGGILSASVALTEPSCLAGFGMVGGRLMPELEPQVASVDSFRHLDALVVHGRNDETLPLQWAERAEAWLMRLGVAHELRLHDAGHELTPAMEWDVLDWFSAADKRWNQPREDVGPDS
ncbi:alpha/beta hydrolase [Lysobacter korlensis]|uniref:Alpha/beta hydrolase n=1 Tax=Lysobacter korlensis TaxID=553636 RepID=A0ABV6RR12_9GAMM